MINDVFYNRLRNTPRGFWTIVKHKPLNFLLPILGFLGGVISIWVIYGIFYYTIRYVARGFRET